MSEFKTRRCIKPKDFGHPTLVQLHHFSDASEEGYGTVSYVRLENSRRDIHVAFLIEKARVTPLRWVTIPCLELTAAVLAVLVDRMLRAEVQLQLLETAFGQIAPQC